MRAKPHCSVLSLVFHIREQFDLSLPCYLIAHDVSIRGHMKRILEGTNLYFDVNEDFVEELALPNDYPGHSQGAKYFSVKPGFVITILTSPFGNLAPEFYLFCLGMGAIELSTDPQAV